MLDKDCTDPCICCLVHSSLCNDEPTQDPVCTSLSPAFPLSLFTIYQSHYLSTYQTYTNQHPLLHQSTSASLSININMFRGNQSGVGQVKVPLGLIRRVKPAAQHKIKHQAPINLVYRYVMTVFCCNTITINISISLFASKVLVPVISVL